MSNVFIAETEIDVSDWQFNKCRKKVVVEACQLQADFSIVTLEGRLEAKAGDYLMRGAKGELYPCKKEIFEETYEWID